MNKAILMGRLTKDPELRTTNSGHSVASFQIAVDRRFKNADGEREADFIPIVCWRKTAEFVKDYFVKGQRIALVGSIQVRSWDENGQRRWMTEVVADEVYFADSKAGGQSAPSGRSASSGSSSSSRASMEHTTYQAPPTEDKGFFDDVDETALPFDL